MAPEDRIFYAGGITIADARVIYLELERARQSKKHGAVTAAAKALTPRYKRSPGALMQMTGQISRGDYYDGWNLTEEEAAYIRGETAILTPPPPPVEEEVPVQQLPLPQAPFAEELRRFEEKLDKVLKLQEHLLSLWGYTEEVEEG